MFMANTILLLLFPACLKFKANSHIVRLCSYHSIDGKQLISTFQTTIPTINGEILLFNHNEMFQGGRKQYVRQETQLIWWKVSFSHASDAI